MALLRTRSSAASKQKRACMQACIARFDAMHRKQETAVTTMTIAADSTPESSNKLKRELKAAEARKRAMALLLVAPLAIFLLLIFVVPIGALLTRAVQNPEIATALPHTVTVLRDWDRKSPPSDAAFAALATDLTAVADGESMGALARRLNTEIPGYRSMVAKTARAMPLNDDAGHALAPAQIRAKLVEIDERWNDVTYWQAIAKNGSRYSPFYLRAAARLSARLLDLDAFRTARQPRDDSGVDSVLDIDPGARCRVDCDSAKRGSRQQGADRQRVDPGTACAAVQPRRRVYLDDAHPAAVHDPAALQRDEVDSADLPEI